MSDEKLQMDIERWKRIHHLNESNWISLAILLSSMKEFRNLFIFRNRFRKLYRWWISFWYKPMNTLFLEAKEIGGGLYIQHGFSTMLTAESVGKNCWINQQVTVGYKSSGRSPIIEDNVIITCGAKVLGPITVGKNSIIGANAVVVKDVEPNSTMVGIPARKIK